MPDTRQYTKPFRELAVKLYTAYRIFVDIIHDTILNGVIYSYLQEFVIHERVVDVIKSFLEIDECDVCVLFEEFSDIANII